MSASAVRMPEWLSFDDAAEAEPAGPPPVAASELDALLADARSHGYLEGHARGLAQATADRAELARRAIEAVAAAMATAEAGYLRCAERAAEALGGALFAALGATLPTLCARHGAVEIAAIAHAILPALQRRPDVTVEVHPGVLAALDSALSKMPVALRRRLLLTPCDELAPGDARLTWTDGDTTGQATREAAATWARVQGVLVEGGLVEGGLLHADPHPIALEHAA